MFYIKVLILVLITSIAPAEDIEVLGGLNLTNGNFKISGQSLALDSGFGLHAGVRYTHKLKSKLGIRSGAQLNYMRTGLETSGVDIDLSSVHLHIPATAIYNLPGKFSVFGGLGLNLMLNQNCETSLGSCGVVDYETFYLDFQLGGLVNLNKKFDIEFFYMLGITDVANFVDLNTFGVHVIYRL